MAIQTYTLISNQSLPAAPPSYHLPRVPITAIANGPNPLVTTAAAHGLVVGSLVTIEGVLGAVECNGDWVVATQPSATTFTITLAAHSPYSGGGAASAGQAIPSDVYAWRLLLDQTNVPSGTSYGLAIQYLYSGGWRDDVSGTMSGGQLPNGTFINGLASTVGSLDASGNVIGERPTRVRARVDQMSAAWVWPSIVLKTRTKTDPPL